MTSHAGRLYAAAAALLVLFLAWTVIATHPWPSRSTARDPRLVTLALRERQLRHEAVLTQQIVAMRQSVYRLRLAQRKDQIAARRRAVAARQQAAAAAASRATAASQLASAPVPAAAPSVRVVTLPPLTITRTS